MIRRFVGRAQNIDSLFIIIASWMFQIVLFVYTSLERKVLCKMLSIAFLIVLKYEIDKDLSLDLQFFSDIQDLSFAISSKC